MLGSRTLYNSRSITEREEILKDSERELECQRSLKYMYEWKEDTRGVSAARIQKRQNIQQKQEIQMANKELVMLRRTALRCLLQEEHLHYQHELNRVGKSLYVQRL
ncbi:cilia- and flagella-associated protein 141 [Phyllobates terribilis]|uniref:cilia- and flagella-associated protein 141 n=1 Tax=Phyllobates terribilis TaxID=111132 RepID=UPI003CCA876B